MNSLRREVVRRIGSRYRLSVYLSGDTRLYQRGPRLSYSRSEQSLCLSARLRYDRPQFALAEEPPWKLNVSALSFLPS